MKSLFSYDSYRKYLKDHYEAKKKANPLYSFRFFAKRAGLQSGNYLKLVMDGDRNLSHKTIHKFIKGLNLTESEALYFENLVFFNQATEPNEKNFYAKNMDLASQQTSKALLTKDQYEVLTNWHPLAIKELGLLPDFELSGRWISNKLNQKITIDEANQAIDLLERLGLITVDRKKGKIQGSNQTMQTPDTETSGAVAQFHKSLLNMAIRSIDEQKIDERALSAVTVAVRKKDLPEAFKKILKFRNEMNAFFEKGKTYDSVYQLAIQLFRVDNDS
jgi:uncharacterized protein (TIGR02147 family)